jgi:hypothetical protein
MNSPEVAAILAASGYRRISNRYRTVARCEAGPIPHGPDWTRRCVSKDKLVLPQSVYKLVPPSDHDKTGFARPHPRLDEAKQWCKDTLKFFGER